MKNLVGQLAMYDLFMMYISLAGKNDIHVKFINRSYRIRGRVARKMINISIIIVDCMIRIKNDKDGVDNFWSSKDPLRIDTNIMFIYSDIKINANGNLAYSVLKPDTSSLSPSAKSKGVRFVSASIQVNQIYAIIGDINKIVNSELFIIH